MKLFKHFLSVPSTEIKKKKKRKCMTQVDKAQHNHLERKRRREMTVDLETLRSLIPSVAEDPKVSQKKIIDEATAYLNKEKTVFLCFLKEKQKFFRLKAQEKSLAHELGVLKEGKHNFMINFFKHTSLFILSFP